MNIEKLLLPYCHPPLAGGTCLGSGEGFEHPHSPLPHAKRKTLVPLCSGSYLWSFLVRAI